MLFRRKKLVPLNLLFGLKPPPHPEIEDLVFPAFWDLGISKSQVSIQISDIITHVHVVVCCLVVGALRSDRQHIIYAYKASQNPFLQATLGLRLLAKPHGNHLHHWTHLLRQSVVITFRGPRSSAQPLRAMRLEPQMLCQGEKCRKIMEN